MVKRGISSETYLIDGREHTSAEVINLCRGPLGKRELVVLSMIEDVAHKKIVDLGCLYGTFCKEISKKFPSSDIIAGDYDEEHLRIARLVYPEIATSFQILNAYELDIVDSSVDVLTFQEVIEHLEGAANAIKEINRVLKTGAELILSTPTAYYWKDMWNACKYELVRTYFKKDLPLSDSIYFQEHEWNRHIYCWTPSTLYTLLKVNGFEYVTHEYCQDGRGLIEKGFLKLFPFFSPTIIMKVKKVSEAPQKII